MCSNTLSNCFSTLSLIASLISWRLNKPIPLLRLKLNQHLSFWLYAFPLIVFPRRYQYTLSHHFGFQFAWAFGCAGVTGSTAFPLPSFLTSIFGTKGCNCIRRIKTVCSPVFEVAIIGFHCAPYFLHNPQYSFSKLGNAFSNSFCSALMAN